MRQTNAKFLKLTIGDTVEVRPNIYDRIWTEATVVRVIHTDIPIKNDPCTTLIRRYELVVSINDRKNYKPLIMEEADVRFNKI